MKERPILFSAPMVRALLDGSKTQTRRVVTPAPEMVTDKSIAPWDGDPAALLRLLTLNGKTCRYGQPGDRLWVREAHSLYPTHGQHRADGERWGPWGGLPTTVSADGKQIAYYREGFDRCDPGRWRPSIHMPHWASRILLEVASIRVERLQDISEADALAEGVVAWRAGWDKKTAATMFLRGTEARVNTNEGGVAKRLYYLLWESINGAGSWAANPWVWVVEFKRIAA